jgi:hypothetical protein
MRSSQAAGNIVGYCCLTLFSDIDSRISEEIKDHLAEIEAGLHSGTIQTVHES